MKKRKTKPELEALDSPWPRYDKSAKLVRTDFRHGIASFSRVSFEKRPITSFISDPIGQKVRLGWESLFELESGSGNSLSFDLLSEVGFFAGGHMTIRRIRSAIKERITEAQYEAISVQYRALSGESGDNGLGEVFLIAVWAQLYAEPFDLVWLAAMAQHALCVERNDYACGYLTAILHQKMEKEDDFLRGRKTLHSASEGGKANSRMARPRTERVVAAMQDYIDRGRTVANAAKLVFEKDRLGTSASANRKAFTRRPKK